MVSKNKDTMNMKNMGFSIDVKTPSTYGIYDNNSMSDGYHVMIGVMPSQYTVPVHVPSGMDITIILAEPIRINERSYCRQHEAVLRYFRYDDPDGISYVGDKLAEKAIDSVGCFLPIGNFFPVNGSCHARALFFISVATAIGEMEGFEDKGDAVRLFFCSFHSKN